MPMPGYGPKGSFVCWQSITIAQLTYSVNLILGLVVATLGFQVTLLLNDKFYPVGWQKCVLFVASYVAGFCDVMAQTAGARAGGNLSMTISARIMQNIFGNTHGDYMWQKVDEAMRARSDICLKALAVGAEDANLFLRKGPTLSLAIHLTE